MKNFWLSPNTEKDDIDLAVKIILGKKNDQAEEKLRRKLALFLEVNPEQIFLFNSGRSAFYTLLTVLPAKKIALQAYTCNAAVNPILWSGKKPVFVDIDDSWNLDPKKLPREIDAVVVQHTFGLPAKIDQVRNFCQKNKLVLIEDCAHSLGGEYRKKKLGKWGDFAFFSFGRDKIISSVYGGALLVNNKNYLEKIKKEYQQLSYPSFSWTRQQLLHPVLVEKLINPLYNFCSIGKIILYLFQKINLLSKAVTYQEKHGKKPFYFPAKLPALLALLAINQLEKIDRVNKHRRFLAKVYLSLLKEEKVSFQTVHEGALPVFLRFGIKVKEASKIYLELKKKGILLDRWLTLPIGPRGTNVDLMGYRSGTCPKAEALAKQELQFPTGIKITEKEVRLIIKTFKKVKNENNN